MNSSVKSKLEYFYTYQTAIGELTIFCNDSAITRVGFYKTIPPNTICQRTTLIDTAYIQLAEYLEGTRTEFNLFLQPEGTAFQLSVWKVLKKIPYGQTRSYSELALEIGKPNASRAVGMAMNKNPILILLPCHRVIGKNGSLVGFGAGLELKKYLLKLEGLSFPT